MRSTAGCAFSLQYDVPSWAIYGVILLLLMYVMPTGVAGGAAKLRDALYRAWRPRQARSPLPEPADTAELATVSDEKQSEGVR